MILSASRRTDIPAFYSDWFFNRLREGFVLVRNPLNYHQVSRVPLNPSFVDCIVFWTKDPSKIMERLDELSEYHYYFQFTLNGYPEKIERNLPSQDHLVESFRELSLRIGKERVVWRYDPILLSEQLDMEYHTRKFKELSMSLKGYTDQCVISFLDSYKKIERNMKELQCRTIDRSWISEIGAKLSALAANCTMQVNTCSEAVDLSEAGIGHGCCIDPSLISSIIGMDIHSEKDKNQRGECGCAASVDIGAYNTCSHGCIYCYANYSDISVNNNTQKHDPNAPMLIGNVEPGDSVTERKVTSCIRNQLKFLR